MGRIERIVIAFLDWFIDQVDKFEEYDRIDRIYCDCDLDEQKNYLEYCFSLDFEENKAPWKQN